MGSKILIFARSLFAFGILLATISCSSQSPSAANERAAFEGGETAWYAILTDATSICDQNLRVLGNRVGAFERELASGEAILPQARLVAESCSAARKQLLTVGVPAEWSADVQSKADNALDLCADAYLRKTRLGNAVADRMEENRSLGPLFDGLQNDLEVHEACIRAISTL